MHKLKHSIYAIENEELKIQSFEKGRRVGKNEEYQLSIKDNEWLVLKNKNQTVELKVLYLSDNDFNLLPKK